MTDDIPETSQRRLAVIGVVCVALFASLFVRLYYLQVIDHQTYQVESQAVHVRIKHEQAPRGRILDRKGRVLVDNKITVVVGIDKEVARGRGLGNGDDSDDDEKRQRRAEVFQRLAVLLTAHGIPTKVTSIEALYSDLRYGPNDFLPIADDGVTEELKAYLGERHDEFPGVVARARTVRVYPYGSLAAHLLGYVGQIIEPELQLDDVTSQGAPDDPAGPDAKPYALDDEIGKSGVERAFERYLRGKPGDTVIQVDARGRRIGTVREPDLRQGDDVWLSIDIDLQALVEQRLAQQIAARNPSVSCDRTTKCNAKEGSAVVIDPGNGEVLAMASYPTFDPSDLVNGISTQLWERLNSKETFKPMLNRAMAEAYAPGSTFKLVSTHAALTHGVIRPEEVYYDRGFYRLEGCTAGKCEFQNAGRQALGNVDLQRAITASSDTYYYRIADLLWRGRDAYGDSPIQDSANLFGFGTKSGIELPSESAGLIGTPEWLADVYAKNPKLWDHGDWKVGDTLNTSIGQGLVAATPLQLANAYATFANGGTRFVPKIAIKVTRPKSLTKPTTDVGNSRLIETFEPKVATRVDFPTLPDYAVVYRGLQGVTSSGAGTAEGAFKAHPTAWPMAGKTGTAQVNRKADTSLFVGFGPAVAPGSRAHYAMAAILPEAGFGADAAAPLVFSVMQQLSNGTVPVATWERPQLPEAGTVATVPTTTTTTTLPLAPPSSTTPTRPPGDGP